MKKRLMKFFSYLLCLSFLLLLFVPVPVQAAENRFTCTYKTADDSSDNSYDYYDYELSSDYPLFLYRADNANDYFYLGVVYYGSAFRVIKNDDNISKYNLQIVSASRTVYSNGKPGDPTIIDSFSHSRAGSLFSLHIYYEGAVRTNRPIFTSLEAAVAYFENGDTSGILWGAKVPGNDPEDPEDDSWKDEVKKLFDSWFGTILESLIDSVSGLVNGIHMVVKKIEAVRSFLIDLLPDYISVPIKRLESSFLEKVQQILEFNVKVELWFVDLIKKVGDLSLDVADSILPDFIKEFILTGMESIENLVSNINNSLSSYSSQAVKNITAIVNWLKEPDEPFFSKVFKLAVFPYSEMIKSLFIPSDGFIDSAGAAIRNKFSSLENLKEGGTYVISYLQKCGGKSAPVFTFDLGDKGGTLVMDFSWYSPYKPSADLLIAGMIWARFLWLIFKRVPDIIQGAGMVTSSASRLEDD